MNPSEPGGNRAGEAEENGLATNAKDAAAGGPIAPRDRSSMGHSELGRILSAPARRLDCDLARGCVRWNDGRALA